MRGSMQPEADTINAAAMPATATAFPAWRKWAVENGIDREVAKALFCQALIGSAKMMTDSGMDIDKLIEMVSSPGGTTIAGLNAMRENGAEKVVREAFDACTKRAYELGE